MKTGKTITVVIPTYNEEENIPLIYEKITNIFSEELEGYDYQIQFVDNDSKDCSRDEILSLAEKDRHVRAIFNACNFGLIRSSFYGLIQAEGDCAVLIFADMQDPPDMIPTFIRYWEDGYKIVIGVKERSKESPIMFFIRRIYYSLLKKISEIEHIEQYNGFGLYDKSFIEVLRSLDDSEPYLRGMVAELGFKRRDIPYVQEDRKRGETKFNFYKLYDAAMMGVTSYSKIVMRFATLIGAGIISGSIIIAIVTCIRKILYWDTYPMGNAAIATGVFFLGAVQLFFLGLLGEYILSINTRVMHRPLVIEEKRINFNEKASGTTQDTPM